MFGVVFGVVRFKEFVGRHTKVCRFFGDDVARCEDETRLECPSSRKNSIRLSPLIRGVLPTPKKCACFPGASLELVISRIRFSPRSQAHFFLYT